MTWLEVSLKRIDAKIHGIIITSFVRIRSGGSQANLQRRMMTVNTRAGYYRIYVGAVLRYDVSMELGKLSANKSVHAHIDG